MGSLTMRGLWNKEEHFQDQWVQKVQEKKNVEKQSHQMNNCLACLKQWSKSYWGPEHDKERRRRAG